MRYHGGMLHRVLLSVLATLSAVATTAMAAEPVVTAVTVTGGGDYLGATACKSCHSNEYKHWQGSHHDLAMQQPSEETVLGDFDNARFVYNGVETRFQERDDNYFVITDGPDGALKEFRVAWVFGVEPLQQYLLPLSDGRLQALSIAWDSRPAAEGGQRWYHLYPDEKIPHDDPLHWTGPYQNWNTRCAECHSTDLKKNYDAATRTFATSFAEEDVACEACHGPGRRHLELAQSGRLIGSTDSGLLPLTERGQWVFDEGEAIARRRQPLAQEQAQQVDTCGRCHARRGTLGEYRHGQPLSDTHRLSLLGEPLYHHDGQILDEVYVYGSFTQSKMYQAGVVCSNCHEPHSNKLRAEGNGVCAQCHRPDAFDTPEHHRHPVDSAGALCVSCHMPDRIYMGVDARRDHSMRVPRPDLSVVIGTPNACNDCHSDHDAQWALDTLREWGWNATNTGSHPSVAMAALASGDARGVPTLLELAADESAAPIWRATALERSTDSGSADALRLANTLLGSNDPLLRVSAARSLRNAPVQQRFAALYPLHNDPVTGVRMEVAASLAETPIGELDGEQREQLLALFAEYLAVQRQHTDMPSVQLQLGLFYLGRRDLPAAEAAYREALRLNPQLLPASLNLADLLRSAGRDEEARAELENALAIAPDNGNTLHALGLLEARAGNRDAALERLKSAAELERGGYRHRFVYAVALHDFSGSAESLKVLRELHREFPSQEQVLLALTNYSAEAEELGAARRYAQLLTELAPGNPAYRRLANSLQSGR